MHPVVVSDLDGTLLNEKHELAPRTKTVIRRLTEEGIKFVFATGRHRLDVEGFRSQVDIEMYTITSNGACIQNPQGEIIISHTIPQIDARALIDLGRKYNDKVFVNVYTDTHWYLEQERKSLLEFHKDTGFSYTLKNLDEIPTDQLIKVFYSADTHEELQAIEKELRGTLGNSLTIAYSLPNCLEVMAKNVNKGYAVNEVLALKGLEAKDAIAFGDGMNDVEMLQTVGKGLVMGNGLPQLRAALPELEVIGENKDDAVAAYLEQQYFN